MFSPSPEQIEYAELLLLLRRANGDFEACRVLADNADIDASIVGFHAQQAVAKSIKLALVLADADLPLTHDLKFLVRQVREAGTEPPQDILDTAWLPPLGSRTPLRRTDRVRSRRRAHSGREREPLGSVAARRREASPTRPRFREEISGGGSSPSARALDARKP